MTASATAPPPARHRTPSAPAFAGRGVLAGLAVGVATSFAQGLLAGPVAGLANAASPWLVAPFGVGAASRTWPRTAAAGLLTCVAEVAGYYATASLRGFGVGTTTLVWLAVALLAGPLFGIAGRLWWTARGRLRGLGAALLVAAWGCEAAVTYGWVLHRTGDAVVFAATAVLLLGVLGLRGRQHAAVLTWLLLALPLGVGGELALHAVL